MNKFILLIVAAITLSSCYTTRGCVKDAKHNQKVAKHRHHQRARQHHSSTNW